MAPTATSAAAAAKKNVAPGYYDLIKEAVLTLKERSGSSRQAIVKFVAAKKGDAYSKSRLNIALKKGVETGKLLAVKGSFKLTADEKKSAKKAAPSGEKTAVKKTKPSADEKTKKAATEKVAKVAKTPVKTKAMAKVGKQAAATVKKPVKKPVKKVVASKPVVAKAVQKTKAAGKEKAAKPEKPEGEIKPRNPKGKRVKKSVMVKQGRGLWWKTVYEWVPWPEDAEVQK